MSYKRKAGEWVVNETALKCDAMATFLTEKKILILELCNHWLIATIGSERVNEPKMQNNNKNEKAEFSMSSFTEESFD